MLILVSPTTVSFMKDIFPQLPESARFACVGEPTAKALTAAFPAAHEILFPHGSSLESGSELLFELLLEEGLPPEVVLIRGDTGRQFLIDVLRDKGVPVTVAPIYKRIPLKASGDQKRWIGRGEAPVVYLTSTGRHTNPRRKRRRRQCRMAEVGFSSDDPSPHSRASL